MACRTRYSAAEAFSGFSSECQKRPWGAERLAPLTWCVRKFLKKFGVTAQGEIEKAVRQALAKHKLKGDERLPTEATVTLGAIDFSLEIKGEIELE